LEVVFLAEAERERLLQSGVLVPAVTLAVTVDAEEAVELDHSNLELVHSRGQLALELEQVNRVSLPFLAFDFLVQNVEG